MPEKIIKVNKGGLLFKVSFEGQPEKGVAPVLYAFDRTGALISSAPVKSGEAQLDISDAQAAKARIFVAPSLEGKRKRTTTVEAMDNLHAYEAHFLFDPKKRSYDLMPVPQFCWQWWLWCACRVRGRVVKPVTIDGAVTDMPVCHARVHICEVDPFWLIIRRLPDDLIARLRDELIVAVEKPIPWPPDPDPGPWFRVDPEMMDFTPDNIARMNQPLSAAPGISSGAEKAAFNPQPDPPGTPLLRNMGLTDSISSRMFNPQPEPPKPKAAEKIMLNPQSFPAEVRSALLSRSLPAVKNALLNNIAIIRPYICWWPWLWPYFYSCDELAVLTTNSSGLFDTTIWYPCFGDHPDLYFWVEYSIGGVWTSVYHPPIRCNTYWNYACGTEVTIRVTDPRVPWCGDPPTLPGKQVAIMTIGNNISLHQIQGAANPATEGLTTDGRPFGGILEPHVWFGQDALIADGITHYKWSYRRMNGVDDWHAMDRQVIRHYAVIDSVTPFTLSFKPALMGPDPAFPTKNLIKIQPTAAPAGSYGWAPMIDARENTASSFFLSHLLEGGNAAAAAGKYELKLELFDTAGNLVNLTNHGVAFKVPTTDGPFGPGAVTTAPPAPEHLILDAGGKVVGFRLVLHVDNNLCEAEIYETSVNGDEAGPCGFITYAPAPPPVAHLSFKARHPHNFATFNFGLYRGSSGEIIDVSGSVATPAINGFTRNASGIYSDDLSVAGIVTGCPGAAAAFAETLYVWAMATDGWSRLSGLDRGATPMAFALKPA